MRGDLQEGNGSASRCQSLSFRAQNRGFCALLTFGTLVFGHFEHKIEVFVLDDLEFLVLGVIFAVSWIVQSQNCPLLSPTTACRPTPAWNDCLERSLGPIELDRLSWTEGTGTPTNRQPAANRRQPPTTSQRLPRPAAKQPPPTARSQPAAEQ